MLTTSCLAPALRLGRCQAETCFTDWQARMYVKSKITWTDVWWTESGIYFCFDLDIVSSIVKRNEPFHSSFQPNLAKYTTKKSASGRDFFQQSQSDYNTTHLDLEPRSQCSWRSKERPRSGQPPRAPEVDWGVDLACGFRVQITTLLPSKFNSQLCPH